MSTTPRYRPGTRPGLDPDRPTDMVYQASTDMVYRASDLQKEIQPMLDGHLKEIQEMVLRQRFDNEVSQSDNLFGRISTQINHLCITVAELKKEMSTSQTPQQQSLFPVPADPAPYSTLNAEIQELTRSIKDLAPILTMHTSTIKLMSHTISSLVTAQTTTSATMERLQSQTVKLSQAVEKFTAEYQENTELSDFMQWIRKVNKRVNEEQKTSQQTRKQEKMANQQERKEIKAKRDKQKKEKSEQCVMEYQSRQQSKREEKRQKKREKQAKNEGKKKRRWSMERCAGGCGFRGLFHREDDAEDFVESGEHN